MLTERCRELLAAYVDGELTNRQRKAVFRLLRRSPEAQALLRQMQQDSEALRQLPRPRLDKDLSAPVLQLIHERRLQPSRRRRRAVEHTLPNLPAWAGFAAAAAVLLLVALGSFYYFTNTQPTDPGTIADRDKSRGSGVGDGKLDKDAQASRDAGAPKDKKDIERAKKEDPEDLPVPPVAVGPGETPLDPKGGVGSEVGSPTDPLDKLEAFNAADLKLARIHKLSDLEGDGGRKQLVKELAKEDGYRIEAPCRDSFKAFERIQAALKANHIGLVIDQNAQARIKARPKVRVATHFVFLIEDVTPDEVIKILRSAAAEDLKAEEKRKGDGQLESLVAIAMTDADRTELSKLVGFKQLPAPAPRKPDAKAPERLALTVPANLVRPLPNSPEIKRFLDNRKPARPGTLQLLLVLREI
jgi:hypothetical protein